VREIVINNKKSGRSLSRRQDFYEREVSEGLKSCTPGEWVIVTDGTSDGLRLLAIANPMSQRSAPIRVLDSLKKGEVVEPATFIRSKIEEAISLRKRFAHLSNGSRLIYGESDKLPGVIVDEYLNSVIIQINTAGMDSYRDLIKETLSELTHKNCYFLDNEEYRKSEGLPLFEKDIIPAIEVEENKLRYVIPKDVLQKVGYYYDHRPNRSKLARWIESSNNDMNSGVDLFSYVGSWGMNMLSAGVKEVTFVDQGDFKETIDKNLTLNSFSEKGDFVRANVFDWVKTNKKTFDVVVSDPPAFSKSLKNKSKALGGYQKLHRSLSQMVHSGSLLAIGSCTHGVTLEELDLTVAQGFQESPFKAFLIDLGHQGADHPIEQLGSSGHYIKFLLYQIVKR